MGRQKMGHRGSLLTAELNISIPFELAFTGNIFLSWEPPLLYIYACGCLCASHRAVNHKDKYIYLVAKFSMKHLLPR